MSSQEKLTARQVALEKRDRIRAEKITQLAVSTKTKSNFDPATAVLVYRPRRPYDGWVGRVVNYQGAAKDSRMVAFRLPGTGESAPGLDEPYGDRSKFTHVLVPVGDLRLLSEFSGYVTDSEEEDNELSSSQSITPKSTMLFTETTSDIAPVTQGEDVATINQAPTGPDSDPAALPYAVDLLTVVSRFVTLKERGTDGWTHWGSSPLAAGPADRFALNKYKNIYKCFITNRSGGIPSFVMALKKFTYEQALEWLSTNYPVQKPENLLEPQEAAAPHAIAAQGSQGSQGKAGQPLGVVDERPSPEEELTARLGPTEVVGETTYQTTNYDLFHLLPENRPVDPGHVRKLVAMITKTNLLKVKPLDVTTTMGVIDGQHRLAAARELGLPIYYKISQQLSEQDITTLNVAQKNWTGADYLHYWTVKGNPDYRAMTDFMKRHPRLSFSNAKLMLTESIRAGNEEFRKGQWKAGNADNAEQVAVLVERVIAEVPSYKNPTHSGFVAALFHCVVNVRGFDPKEFMRTVLLQPRALVPGASHKQFMETFDAIYNFRKTEAHRLKFD